MRFLARAFLLLLLALPVLVAAAAWMAVQDAPTVVRDVQLTPQDVANAKRIIDAQDPRKRESAGPRTVVLNQHDLDLLLNYAASRLGRGAARAALQPGSLRLQASVEIPRNPFGRYLNLDAELRETDGLPRFDRLRVGRLPVPAAVADLLLREGLRRSATTERGALAADVVRGVSLAGGRLTVTYAWSGDIERRARTALVSAEHEARLRAYHDALVGTLARAPSEVSLATLMPPLFRKALERGASGDPGAENRAAILVLAFYANGSGLAAIAPSAARWPQPARRTVTLAGRDDFPRHFLISAAIAAEAGTPLADAVGLYKEIDDSRGGSGFSFNDIAADRAGTRFGELAGRSPERARKLARAVAAGVAERDFMPEVSDLPEFMPEAEFKRRYGGVDGPGYNAMMATIETRVASLPLLR